MAGINTTYYGLLRDPTTLGVETTTANFANYTEVIRLEEGLPSNYYYVSLRRDPRFNSVDYPTEFFNEIEDDLEITLVDGDVFVTRPLDEGLTKEQRQVMKLEISAKKRTRDSNPRDTYDVNLLPNPYNGNSADPDDGDAGPLNQGRPWS